ncbi:MAG TPA: urea ABC transporter substrate-binding protein [Burkholderiaceae bacterium]
MFHIALPVVLVSAFAAHAAEALKIGVLEDTSGGFASAGIAKLQAVQLAAAEINAKGGVAGRPIQVVAYDTQSENTRYQEMARRLIQQDKVDVVFGGYTSASREAIRPIVDRSKMLYFYNNEYEGGVCDANVFVTGPVPEMQFGTLIPWLVKQYGPKAYYIGADYNFGQISGEWVKQYLKESGGSLVGEEYIPLSVSQYSQTIANIQKAKPDFVVAIMVGPNQVSFFEQQGAAGLNLPMASSIAVAASYEHKRFKPPAMSGMHVPANFVDELGTPASNSFIARFKAKFPDSPYVGQLAVDSYNATYLYAEAVKRAQTSEKIAVRKALEGGDACFEGPGGKVCIDAKSHHTSMPIYLAQVQKDHSIQIPQRWSEVKPTWLPSVGCDLTRKDQFTQYTPGTAPKAGK